MRGGYRGMMSTGKPRPEGSEQPVDRATVLRVAAFFRPYRVRVLISVIAILIVATIGLVNPLLLKLIIDDAIPNRDLNELYLYIGLMIALPVVTGLIGVGQSYLNTVIGQNVMRDLRNTLYGHLQRMSLRFFTSTRTGEIQARMNSDIGGVQQVVTDTATSIVSNLATALSTIVAMWLISWQMALISLGMLPIFLVLTYKVGNTRREVTTSTQRVVADLSTVVEETLSVSGMVLTKAFGQQSREVERFRRSNEQLSVLQVRQQMVGRWFFMIISTFFSITPAVVYWYAGRQIIGGSDALTIGSIVAFTTLQSRLFFPIGQLLNVQVEIQGAFALFDRIFEYIDLPVEIADRPGAEVLEPEKVRGQVRYRHVSFEYNDAPMIAELVVPTTNAPDVVVEPATIDGFVTRPFVLEDIDFTVEPGQLAALVGPSGSGKTTIAMLLPRFYEVSSGAVEIDGTDVRDVTLESLGKVIGIVNQETYLFHASIRENISYGKNDATQVEIEQAARAAAIHDRIMELPNGYDTIAGERGYKLSGGEKQRVAIARVILKDPRILILDEATSALDTHSERAIQNALEPLMKNRTTLAIAHRLSTILAADVILVIERGHVVERGTHSELLKLNGLYSRLYREQFASGAAPTDGISVDDAMGSRATAVLGSGSGIG